MTKKSTQFPFFLILFSLFPGLSLLAWNIREVDWPVVVRPLLISLALALLILLIIRLFVHNWIKASLMTGIALFCVFSYGHVYDLMDKAGLAEMMRRPNRILPIIFGVLFIFLSWLIVFRMKETGTIVNIFNIIGIVLVASPLYQIISYDISNHSSDFPESTLTAGRDVQKPDIYFFILDGYGRNDNLEELGFDNSKFTGYLESRGFYVATCGRSNYYFTLNSLTSLMNMNYIYNLFPDREFADSDVDPVIKALRYNQVRADLQHIGYIDVAFNKGYRWAVWRDADIFIRMTDLSVSYYLFSDSMNQFEYMLLSSTLFGPVIDKGYLDSILAFLHGLIPASNAAQTADQSDRSTESTSASNEQGQNVIDYASMFTGHYNDMSTTLKAIPELVSVPGPKFVFAHIMTPHAPFIFLPDGSFNPDPNYYGTEDGMGVTDEYSTLGYINNIQFINSKMEDILDYILENSAIPPIIIVQGDHGLLIEEERHNILNAYYLPGGGNELLYPTITPVNTFRLIFDYYFGANYPLLEDMSIEGDIDHPYSQREYPVTACP